MGSEAFHGTEINTIPLSHVNGEEYLLTTLMHTLPRDAGKPKGPRAGIEIIGEVWLPLETAAQTSLSFPG